MDRRGADDNRAPSRLCTRHRLQPDIICATPICYILSGLISQTQMSFHNSEAGERPGHCSVQPMEFKPGHQHVPGTSQQQPPLHSIQGPKDHATTVGTEYELFIFIYGPLAMIIKDTLLLKYTYYCEKRREGWRDESVGESIRCPCRGPGCGSKQPGRSS